MEGRVAHHEWSSLTQHSDGQTVATPRPAAGQRIMEEHWWHNVVDIEVLSGVSSK